MPQCKIASRLFKSSLKRVESIYSRIESKYEKMLNNDAARKKKRVAILESLEASDFEGTLAQTKTLIDVHGSTDSAFKMGTRILTFLTGLQEKSKLKAAHELFKTWLKFCLEFDQVIMTKTAITYYGVMYAKNMIAEKLYEPALEIIEMVQEVYKFKSELETDPEFEKYIKFTGTCVYNESLKVNQYLSHLGHLCVLLGREIHGEQSRLKKEFISKNMDLASKYYIQGQQFYIKLETSAYSLLDSVRSYSLYFVKTNTCDQFYRDMFAMLNKLIQSCNAENTPEAKRAYLANFQLNTIVHLISIGYSYGFEWFKSMVNDQMTVLRELIGSGLPVIAQALDLIDLVLNYVNQYQKQSTPRHTNTKNVNQTIVHVLKDNAVLERRLLHHLTDFYDSASQEKSYYQFNLLINIIEMFSQGIYRYINNSSVYAKCIQASFLEFFTGLCTVYSDSIKVFHKLPSESGKQAKFSDRPLILYLTWERILEHSLKLNNQTMTKHSEMNISLCEKTILGHRDFLAWIEENKSMGQEEMEKSYVSLESQIIKYCSLIYSEDALSNYIRFQRLSLDISMARLNFLFTSDKARTKDVGLLKNFHSVSENLLLSLRLNENFEEALQIIKKVFEFISSFSMELTELEWIVTNWCKIKRDLWKAQNSTYAKVAITDYLSIVASHSFTYLIEEIHTYNSFRTIDTSVTMNDEIQHVLERLDNMKQQTKLNKSRVILEIAQFTLSNHDLKNERFQLKTDEYLEQAKKHLDEHRCDIDLEKDMKSLCLEDEDKENKEVVLIEEECEVIYANSKKSTRPRKAATLKAKPSSKAPAKKTCSCASSSLVNFQISLFKMLSDYSISRSATYKALLNLIQVKMKIKKNTTILTNTDNLFLESASNQHSICPEICDESRLHMSNDELVRQMDEGLAIIEQLAASPSLLKDFYSLHSMFKKQFYECVDLLAQVYGFFGILASRVRVLKTKFALMHADYVANPVDINYEQLFTNTIVALMKALLSAGMFEEFLAFKNELVELTAKQENQVDLIVNENDFSFIESSKFFSKKPEALVAFHLAVAHYFIMRHRHEEALVLMQEKILTSSVVNGKPTSYYFEIKYYLRYLQFMLSMSNLNSKCQKMFKAQIEEETPLSLLEESSSAAFSVARYYLKSSIEPARVLSVVAIKQEEEREANEVQNVFFDIGNSESYRILSETLDILQNLCRYYIEISRYRDAIAYIKESLEISQLHLSTRRIAHFLYEQINADIIASAFNEATVRIKVADNLIQFTKPDAIDWSDIYAVRGIVFGQYLKAFKAIKSGEVSDVDAFLKEQTDSCISGLAKNKAARNFCKDTLLKFYFMMVEFCKSNKKKKDMVNYLKLIKELLFKSHDTTPCAIYENWFASEYYCIFFEIEQNSTYLNQAYEFIKTNPHPLLYKRICVQKCETETEDSRRLYFLLETQSIALRHKACAIQLKHKRKSTINPGIYEKTMAHVSFSGYNSHPDLVGLTQSLLPDNCVIVAMVLINSTDLWIIRIETGTEPLLFKLAYNQKFSVQFKTILAENDQSMRTQDRSKFWNSRSLLNTKLANFLQDIETNMFSYAKALLLGSLVDFDLKQAIKAFCAKFGIKNLTKAQEKTLKLIFIGLDQLVFTDILAAFKSSFEGNVNSYALYIKDEVIKNMANTKRKHVCMLIDKHLHQLPWECLPVTKKQSISRMPSIHFLLSHLQINGFSIDKDKAFYIVDPGGDLQYTKQKFQSIFDKKKKWDGIIGVPPNESVFKRALTEYELFIYTGHGSGSQYYPSDDVQRLKVQACSILMGCSSGSQYTMGDFEPYGTILAYILAGCPCIVGNLWDVTDRDIDRFTEEFLESWLNDNEQSNSATVKADKQKLVSLSLSNICVHLIKARDSCRMAYLNGSAPIAYGLPVNFKPSKSNDEAPPK